MKETRLRAKVRIAGFLVLSGLAVQALTLFNSSPTSFLVFAMVGITLVVVGALYFVWVYLRAPRLEAPSES